MAAIRSFVAIELPEEVKTALASVQRDLKAQIPPKAVRWTRPESIHLTLQFLGDVALGQVEAVTVRLREACAGHTPFTFHLKELGVFPNPVRPRVVWIGVVEPSGALLALHKKVALALEPLGFKPEERAFTPHLTLGRAAQPAGRRELAEVGELITHSQVGTVGQVWVDHINLMKSDLRPEGAVYTALAVLPFGT
jgi:2'-5' RNA ligase